MTDIPTYLTQNRLKIQQCLADFLPRHHAHPEIKAFYAMMWDYPSRGGKGLRSSLCLLICQAFGGDPEQAVRTAAAIELFQNWILIHDDIEDASDLRRGEPCLHKKHGVAIALNVGDALHAQMWRLLHENVEDLGYERAFRVLREFGELVSTVAVGQHIELSWVTQNRWDVTERDYYTMCEAKTASYTCISPCRLGALIAGADERALEAFREIGRTLGLAFQLQDDVLNLIGEEGRYGKEIAGDLWEGKRTLMLIHLQQHCTPSERRRVQHILNKPRLQKHEDEIAWILERMHVYGSIAYAQRQAEQFAQLSKRRFLEHFPSLPDAEAGKMFLDFVDFLIRRDH